MGITHQEKFVPIQTRSERVASTKLADFPEVTGREAQWVYTPVAKLQELLNGPLQPAKPSVSTTCVAGIKTSFIARDDKRIGSVYKPEDRAAAQAFNVFEKALLIEVSGESEKDMVIRLSDYGTEASGGHIFVDVKPYARGLVTLIYSGDAKLADTIEIRVGEGARVTFVSLGEFSDSAIHLSQHHAEVGKDAFLKHIVVNMSGSVVRVNPSVQLAHQGGDVEMYGLYFADPGQHLEHQVWVHHIAPNCRSRVNYKGALQGNGSHTVWIGDVLIGPNAVGTDSYEENRNLVLGNGPIADSVPNLEIECGDIAGAGHASATGRFDEEHLFYLMARGIDELTARRLVVRGFLNEIVQQIEHEEIAADIQSRLDVELERSDAAIVAGMGR
ncbi:Fe-S cluster assembly protein SufD [Canibacter sp. lx-72]|uniref:Fe-S cluster assembly protein SufD n=1 Tax=Canibacter zhuwentaonis TaxID=2837491 RepID=UPI001BDD23A5|nr:Fe-S cluster assembly protein SufD [Canibacter zhuwentaonis]MBT1017831.1 Fe-S cluster assembly protein SufD [Canibacter zhuwentaonis]MBT1034994.1 Fe-S cluster assembly protein SufD [Canibacter zhuwentaonis]